MKRILVSVTNDLVTDNRMNRICSSLVGMGFRVVLIGRKLKNSLPLEERAYATRRMRLFFNKGPLFYSEYSIRLFFVLLFSKSDILLSNDLDTLPANYLVSRIKSKPLVYDSHEFYTEVPELMERPAVRRFWLKVEKMIIPKLKNAYTVSDSIAREYEKRYGTEFKVIRNVPVTEAYQSDKNQVRRSSGEKTILYQGSLNEARGLEFAIQAMKFVSNARFIIAGDGVLGPKLKNLVTAENLEGKVTFTGRLSPDHLKIITSQADLGLSVEEDKGLNYRFALPNKLFDYIHAGIPVLVNNLPEMAAIVSTWQIGLITPSLEPEVLAQKMEEALFDETIRAKWAINLKKAAAELNWEKEEPKLWEIFRPLIG